MWSSPDFADSLPQDTVDSDICNFLFRHIDCTFSDTAFFPSNNAKLMRLWNRVHYNVILTCIRQLPEKAFSAVQDLKPALFPASSPPSQQAHGSQDKGSPRSVSLVAWSCRHLSCGCDEPQVIGCSETSLTPLKLCRSHLLECSHPCLPRLRDLQEDFSRNVDMKYGYFMPCQALIMPTHSCGWLWQVICLGPMSLHQYVCSRLKR